MHWLGFPITPCSIWIVNPHGIHHLAPVTQVVALVCLADPCIPSGQRMQQVYNGHEGVVESHIAALQSKLPAVALPDIWIVVEKLPRIDHQELDRHWTRQWLKG
ncbi:hypothetical protein E4U32_007227 [Claviceps aff. humidiphila group G2b]|nr:hypothetical protein E4U32_007227 [Claviceps aff. humidiphila group G2b]